MADDPRNPMSFASVLAFARDVSETPDADLIALCDAYVAESQRKHRQWQLADAAQRRLMALDFSPWLPRQEIDPLFNMAQRISRTPARTPQGLRAKARMLKRWLVVTYAVGDTDDEPRFGNEAEMAAAWSLVQDMLAAKAP